MNELDEVTDKIEVAIDRLARAVVLASDRTVESHNGGLSTADWQFYWEDLRKDLGLV